MAGDRFRLEVKERTGLGTPESRRLRKQGFIPGILYGRSVLLVTHRPEGLALVDEVIELPLAG